jgi:hypothetical protein
VRKQHQIDRSLAQDERRNAACLALLTSSQELSTLLIDITTRLKEAMLQNEPPLDFDYVRNVDTMIKYMMPVAQVVGGEVRQATAQVGGEIAGLTAAAARYNDQNPIGKAAEAAYEANLQLLLAIHRYFGAESGSASLRREGAA